MPYIKITYGSRNDSNARTPDYVKVRDEDVEEDGSVSDETRYAMWRDLGEADMVDSLTEVVQNIGD